jgi:4-amino-4-deoxy-L-arabinose transferase-like glycosyltransferase
VWSARLWLQSGASFPGFSLPHGKPSSRIPRVLVQSKALEPVPDSSQIHPWKTWNRILLAAFFLCLLPILASPSRFHGDERFYTDAAMRMVQSGDYWTPHYPDGRIRLLKPILTYWAAACSFNVLGISLFAARVPFLLAAVALLYYTGRLARTIFNREDVAFLSVLILASNIAIITLATRSTPDVLVCLFSVLSMWGFARIWFAGDRIWGPLLAFAGMGLAVQTKGLLGLCPLAANLVFCFFAKPDRARLKLLLNWPALLLGIGLAVFWYWVMLDRHGLGAMHDFYADQVGAKMSRSPGFVLGNLAVYLLAFVRHFLPWSLIVLILLIWKRGEIRGFWTERRSECIFLLSLAAVLVVVFVFGNARRTRYLTAGYPMLAVLLAAVLSFFRSDATMNRRLVPVLKVVAVTAGIAGVILLIAGISSHWLLAAGGVALLLTAIAGLIWIQSTPEARWNWIAAVCIVCVSVLGACIRPVFAPSQLQAALAQLQELRPGNRLLHTWNVQPSAAGQVRVLSGGTITVTDLKDRLELDSSEMILTRSPHQEELRTLGFELHQVTTTNTSFAATRVGRLTQEKADKTHKDVRPVYWIALKPYPSQ